MTKSVKLLLVLGIHSFCGDIPLVLNENVADLGSLMWNGIVVEILADGRYVVNYCLVLSILKN